MPVLNKYIEFIELFNQGVNAKSVLVSASEKNLLKTPFINNYIHMFFNIHKHCSGNRAAKTL